MSSSVPSVSSSMAVIAAAATRRRLGPHDGMLLLIDKPRGMTARAASMLATKGIEVEERIGTAGGGGKRRRGADKLKVGHVGTLDPMATGALPVLVGQATKLATHVNVNRKRYVATLKLGVETDSQDADGKVLHVDEGFKGLDPTTFDLQTVLQKFKGIIKQVPPSYSAITVNGVRAYDAARAGKPLELAARSVHIFDISGIIRDPFLIDLDVTCGSGTYIRTVGVDVAKAIGTVGHLINLRRICSGKFAVPEIPAEKSVQGEVVVVSEFGLRSILEDIGPCVEVSDELLLHVKNGRSAEAYRGLMALLGGMTIPQETPVGDGVEKEPPSVRDDDNIEAAPLDQDGEEEEGGGDDEDSPGSIKVTILSHNIPQALVQVVHETKKVKSIRQFMT